MNIKNIVIILLLSIFALVFSFWYLNQRNQKSNMQITSTGEIRYVAIGDSYTIGYGVLEVDRWPNVLVNNLKKEGIDINLVANPSVSGFMVRDTIDFELPEVEKISPGQVCSGDYPQPASHPPPVENSSFLPAPAPYPHHSFQVEKTRLIKRAG